MEALGSVYEMELGEAAPSEQRQRTNRLPVTLNSDPTQADAKCQWHTEVQYFVFHQHTAMIESIRSGCSVYCMYSQAVFQSIKDFQLLHGK